MQHHVYRSSGVSRHAFQSLIGLWVFIAIITFVVALIMSSSSAKAEGLVPFPKVEKIFEPAVLQSFSPSPSPALVNERCQPFLHPTHTGNVNITTSSRRTQRNAEPKSLQTVVAIKAYRQCVSQIALEQLANK